MGLTYSNTSYTNAGVSNTKGVYRTSNDLIGYKKISCLCDLNNKLIEKELIAQVTIPKDATINRFETHFVGSSYWNNKLMTNQYKIESIYNPQNYNIKKCYSLFDNDYEYIEGKTYKEDNGLYFYADKSDAEQHTPCGKKTDKILTYPTYGGMRQITFF